MKMKYFIFSLLMMLAVSKAVCRAADSPLEFVSNFTIALPRDSKVEVKLLAPPLPDAALDTRPLDAPVFTVGEQDDVWLGLSPGTLLNARQGYQFALEEPISDIACMQGGALLAASRDALGFIGSEQVNDGGSRVFFQPFAGLPVRNPRLSVGTDNSLYIFGLNESGERYEVYLVRSGKRELKEQAEGAHALRKIFSSTERVSAVSGDGGATFVATGRLVLRLSGDAKTARLYFVHPKEDILQLTGSLATGLFYATGTAVGVISDKGPLEFIQARNAGISLTRNSLYILLKNSLAVVKLSNAVTLRSLPDVRKSKNKDGI